MIPIVSQLVSDYGADVHNQPKIHIVKDLSRLGRDYVTVGQYTETLWTRTQKADHETGAADNK